jgi:carbamoylphosphate synthase small subunit
VLLEDGSWFAGSSRRALSPAFGEVVFTTNLTGYQETFTDPSYLGQIVVMTAPMIGNYGVNEEDMESAHPQVSGVVVRELSRHYSNWRATCTLDEWLALCHRAGQTRPTFSSQSFKCQWSRASSALLTSRTQTDSANSAEH